MILTVFPTTNTPEVVDNILDYHVKYQKIEMSKDTDIEGTRDSFNVLDGKPSLINCFESDWKLKKLSVINNVT